MFAVVRCCVWVVVWCWMVVAAGVAVDGVRCRLLLWLFVVGGVCCLCVGCGCCVLVAAVCVVCCCLSRGITRVVMSVAGVC